MAIRKIREIGDEVLTKVCKEVTTGWNSQKNRCHRYRRRSGCHDQPTHRREQRRTDRGRRMP